MEAYSDILKSKISDPSFDYRKESMLRFLKSPVRDYKESPTVKDYVEVTDIELVKMATGNYSTGKTDKSKSALCSFQPIQNLSVIQILQHLL